MGQVYFDYSTIVDWSGEPTGIPRTVFELAESLEGRVTLIGINDDLGHFQLYEKTSRRFQGSAEFEKGDWLVSTGATWAHACYPSVVQGLRDAGIHYAQLFYDMIPYLFPHMYADPEFGAYYGRHVCEMLRLCNHAFAISESTKNDLRSECQYTSEYEIDTVRLGDSVKLLTIQDDVASNEAVSDLKEFVLSVGTIEFRKNHKLLLDAYRLLVGEGVTDLPTLVIVGREGFHNNELNYQAETDPILKGRVEIISDISDRDLDYLYRHCLFTLFPSCYEGWGLPVAESLRHGKQCITSNSSSMPEIAPTLTRFAHPLKVEEWAGHIKALCGDRETLKNECQQIVKDYQGATWSECADFIINKVGNR